MPNNLLVGFGVLVVIVDVLGRYMLGLTRTPKVGTTVARKPLKKVVVLPTFGA